jgi:hypothetical protein
MDQINFRDKVNKNQSLNKELFMLILHKYRIYTLQIF